MRSLIIGARGMLGSALRDIYKDESDILEWDKDDIDITHAEDVQEKIMSVKPSLIINAAAYTDVDGAEANRSLAFAVNAEAVRTLASVASALRASFVHYSTDYVFGGSRNEGYCEEDMPGPAVNVYGESKLQGELFLLERARLNPSFRYFLIRTSWLYGPSGKNFVGTILRLSAERDEIRVVNDQFGKPTHTCDLAAATRKLLSSYPSGVYHITNETRSGGISWFDFASAICRLRGLATHVFPSVSSEFPRPAKRPSYSALRNTKFPLLRPWQDALEEYLQRSS